MIIRKATEADLFPICNLMLAGVEEIPQYADVEINKGKGAYELRAMIADPNAIVLVSVKDDLVTGVIFGTVQSFWFSDEKFAHDQMLYVHHQHRTGSAGIKLLKGFIEAAKGKGAVRIFSGVTSGVNIEKASKLLDRLGFEQVGKAYRLNV